MEADSELYKEKDLLEQYFGLLLVLQFNLLVHSGQVIEEPLIHPY